MPISHLAPAYRHPDRTSNRYSTRGMCFACRTHMRKPSRYKQSPTATTFRTRISYPRNSPEWRREHKLRQLYGLTIEMFEILFQQQRGQCAICRVCIGRTVSDKGRAHVACVDHDYKTLRVRGLLCHRCNVFLGKLERYLPLLPHITVYLFNGDVSHSENQ